MTSKSERHRPKRPLGTACKTIESLFPDAVDEKKAYRNVNPLLPQHPFRLAICGPSGGGKTTILANILALNPVFDKIYVFCLDQDEPLYQALQQDARLITMSSDLEEMPTYEELKEGEAEQTLFVFDDLITLTPKQLKPVVDLFIAGRKANCSAVFLSQSYFKIPLTIRNQLTGVILTRLHENNVKGLKRLVAEMAADTTAEDMLVMYKKAVAPDPKLDAMSNFLYIDPIPKDRRNKFRRGFGHRLCWPESVEAKKDREAVGRVTVAKL